MPYVLIVLGVFIGMCLLLNLFCNQGNQLSKDPSEHWMGVVGYYICFVLFGVFGPSIFVLPILLLNLAFFWKKYVDNRVLTSKIVSSLLFLIFLGTFIHVCCLGMFEAEDWSRYCELGYLFEAGAMMTGGGVIGGTLAFWSVSLLNLAGSIILYILLLLATLFFCLGMTPQIVWEYFRAKRGARRAQKLDEAEAKQRKAEKAEPAASDAPATKEAQQAASPEKKATSKDGMAPMPMPLLDPSHGTKPFVPKEVSKGIRAEERKNVNAPFGRVETASAASSGALKRATPQATSTVTSASAAPVMETVKINTTPNRDEAVEPIFPKTADNTQRKVPKQDRDFDLKKVFVDFDDDDDVPSPQKHAAIPPEVPLTGAASAATSAAASVTGAAANAQKPIFRHAEDMENQEYGLSNEEFETLEAGQNAIDNAVKKAAKKASEADAKDGKKPASEKATEEKEAEAPKAPALVKTNKNYVFPPISYLHPGEPMTAENRAEIEEKMAQLAETLQNFNVRIKEINYACGPTVTRYEVFPAPGVRVRSFVNLADDISLALASGGIRIEAPIPGKSAVGVEVPNKTRCTVYLRDLIESKAFKEASSKVTAGLGADITGKPLLFDIAKMPHLLVAGTTGSGKSVCINCIILSLIYKAKPDEVKLVLIDPKKVEFGIYKNIPHLMAPIVTTPKDAAGALQAAVEEMERRFELFEQVSVHNLKGFNDLTKNDPDMPFLPQIVIIIDELADLMMTAPDEVETAICRIAQKARAAGIHLIVGTQRPSVDVVTGLIKSNMPSRIAFTVASQVDSKTILDYAGAEKLAGMGDMLFAPIGALKPARVQGAFVNNTEIEKICDFVRSTNGTAQYDEKFISKLKELAAQCGSKGKGGGGDSLPDGGDGDGKSDNKYADAVRVAVEEKRISTSLLQRKLEIGYSRAAKIIDRMQAEGIVSAPDGSKPRSVLITPEEYIARFVDNLGDEEAGE